MTIMASASRAVQEPAALAIPLTGPGSGGAFTDPTHAKQRHVCANRGRLIRENRTGGRGGRGSSLQSLFNISNNLN